MKLIATHRYASAFLGATSLFALYIILTPGTGNDWMLDPLTGIVAIATSLIVCMRLALGAQTETVRRLWLAVLALLLLVCISQFAESFGDHIEASLGLEDVDDGLLMIVAPLLLWITARCEPVPSLARWILWLAFASQFAGMICDFLDDGRIFFKDDATWSVVSDVFDLVTMQLYLLGATVLVAALRWQLFTINRRVSHLGDVARYLFVSRRLFDRHRYPRIHGLPVPGGKVTLGLVRFLVWFWRVAPRVRDAFGRSLWDQFRDICVLSFRHGLDAQAYYMFELFRPQAMSRAPGYLTRYETKNGLFKVLTWQIPKGLHRTKLGDKLAMAESWQRHGVAHIPTLIVAQAGALRFATMATDSLAQDLFVKPTHSKGARGTEVLRYADSNFIDDGGALLSRDQMLQHLKVRSKDADLIVQPRIQNHPHLADLAEQSLIVIRVITCLDDAGTPQVTHGMLRILCKLEPTWSIDAEFGVAVDLEAGTLGRMAGDKAEILLDWYDEHPITGAKILGRRVPHWDGVRAVALAAHRLCSDRLLVGWDVAIGPDGPLLVEGNSYADVDFLQRVHRSPISESPLGRLLFDRVIDIEHRIATATLCGKSGALPVRSGPPA